ncbi:hypothetical protein P4637_05070 [Halalkalibacterium halodurans]|uniref:BH3778 protein n=2 Tax=Halalkalibacterium halodurans TaxID=86665 RepID=Q9K6F1_HALH5|nr:hypothetical protein [Halalkalibacterium halodurans]MDY7224283.1 hypothetical protein [Halalkalibacterium halodurans]MDY7243568.1 hypothetical protein [Halalkalibacterium halodurans]MED4079488.1 hypothetical protein [Halalkalibacterium halodurans]MED4084235.1 hypothetical protein [Halalkalibacterium halodurans]MED4104712.1 hypothetical protein [Halalkalibacterium halodurans]
MRKGWIACMVALTCLVGCREMERPQAQGLNERPAGQVTYGLLGPGPANYDNIYKRSIAPDAREQNSGPSFRTAYETRPTIATDIETIRSIIQDEHGLRSSMVMTAGSHAWVNVEFPRNMKKEQRNKIMNDLREDMQRQIPRYQVHLSQKGG